MMATKIFGYTGFVFILCFLAYGFWEWNCVNGGRPSPENRVTFPRSPPCLPPCH